MRSSKDHRSALFVDFDNIYIGLSRGSTVGAERFATKPQKWLQWLEEGGGGDADNSVAGRRILVRRCYLNPQQFARYRPFFMRAGFEVVDTPALTAQGKTSADMLMALDIMDARQHATHFDEFIVFSGDADFTPVLLRLRKHDRRTAVLTAGSSAASYRAACDLAISEETFLERALGVDGDQAASRAPASADRNQAKAGQALLRTIAEKVKKQISLSGNVRPTDLPAIYKGFEEFLTGDSWLGYFSLRGMTEAVVDSDDQLAIIGEDPWWVGFKAGAGEEPAADTAAQQTRFADPENSDWQGEVAEFLKNVVQQSDRPVSLATLAQKAMDEFGEEIQSSRWAGAGTFKGLLEKLDLAPMKISSGGPGYVFDPANHEDPGGREPIDDFSEEQPELAQFARSINDLTNAPYLSPQQYALVIDEIVKEVHENGFDLVQTSKAVRDRCYGKGAMVARAAISFLLKGLLYSGFPFDDEQSHTPEKVAEVLIENTEELSRRAQMDLTDEQRAQIREWIAGQVKPLDEDTSSDPGPVAETEPVQ